MGRQAAERLSAGQSDGVLEAVRPRLQGQQATSRARAVHARLLLVPRSSVERMAIRLHAREARTDRHDVRHRLGGRPHRARRHRFLLPIRRLPPPFGPDGPRLVSRLIQRRSRKAARARRVAAHGHRFIVATSRRPCFVPPPRSCVGRIGPSSREPPGYAGCS